MKKLLLIIFLQCIGIQLFAQDPELLMNEARYAIQIHTFETKDFKAMSVGPSVGLSGSLGNLIFGNFNKKKFRIGDLIGGDICPLGYSNGTNAPIPVYLWVRTELGLQAYYAINTDLYVGLKAFHQLNLNWDLGVAGLVFQPVIRYNNWLAESNFGIDNQTDLRHFQISLKYIFLHEDALSGIFVKFERAKPLYPTDNIISNQFSIGYSIHFSSNR